MVMSERVTTATNLKATLLGALDDVERTGESIVVTKHGRPVAKLVPIEAGGPLAGSVKFLVDDDALIAPIDVAWDVEA